MQRFLARSGVLSLLFLALLLDEAFAQVQPAEQQNVEVQRERAAELAEKGTAFAEEKRYDEALKAFAEAFTLHHVPRYLWNLARCQENLGKLEAATISFKLLLEFPDAGDYAPKARQKLAELAPKLKPAPAAPASTSVRASGADSRAAVHAISAPPPAQSAQPETASPPQAAPRRSSTIWLGLSVGTVALGLGVGVAGKLLAHEGSLTVDGAKSSGDVDAGNERIDLGNAMQIGGLGVAVAAGLTSVLIFALRGSGPQRVSAVVVPGPGDFGLAFAHAY